MPENFKDFKIRAAKAAKAKLPREAKLCVDDGLKPYWHNNDFDGAVDDLIDEYIYRNILEY